uniref:Arf-GAP domain-containing protein n=1 Tax=Parastrongyloides trichosuri TaxID=131310 RepID=A0A0N4ZCP9_PARTI
MNTETPSSEEIQQVLSKLKAQPSNKICFDCNARNPTWATVTYGVFICIDCSAVHRNLGVHITFVRSTNLDTNWTWQQLRAMQVSGNVNASKFFKEHGCETTDSQQKYKSRAATMYREKVAKMAQLAHETCKGKLFIDNNDSVVVTDEKEEEEDFFTQKFNPINVPAPAVKKLIVEPKKQEKNELVDETSAVESQPIKSSLINKKPAKKIILGNKKGLGATKVSTNFSEIEQKAIQAEKEREAASKFICEPEIDEETGKLSSRLMMQNLDDVKKANEKRIKSAAADPKKAEVVERLGMGGIQNVGISHSVSSGIHAIKQVGVKSKPSQKSSYLDSWDMLDDTEKNDDNKKSGEDDDFFDTWKEPKKTEKTAYSRPTVNYSSAPASDEALKKFGNAKSISSDAFFGKNEMDTETRANLARFDGATSLGSADLFGNGQAYSNSYSYNSHVPEMSDIKDSVRQGVSKVAGKLSSLSSTVSSYLNVSLDTYTNKFRNTSKHN